MWNPFKKKDETSEALTVCEVSEVNSPDELITIHSQPPCINDSMSSILQDSYSTNLQMAEMTVGLVRQAMDVYQTSLQVEQNIAAIRAASDVQLANITNKFEFCKNALEHVFQDRHSALSAHYAVLGDAMQSNDRELIIAALKGISSIVITSPLSDFKEIVSTWDGYSAKKPLELDF